MIHFEDYEREALKDLVYLQEESIPEFAIILTEGLNLNYGKEEITNSSEGRLF